MTSVANFTVRLQDEFHSGVALLLVHHHPLHSRRSDQREADQIELPHVACPGPTAVRAVQLNDLLTSEEKQPDKEITIVIDEKSVKQHNPAYTAWMVRDQVVLGYLYSLLTHETLMHVLPCTSSAQAWRMLTDLYAS
jgi:hypothetical protein